jgi:hypothetical protein
MSNLRVYKLKIIYDFYNMRVLYKYSRALNSCEAVQVKSLFRDETSDVDKVNNPAKCILSLVDQLSSEDNN